MMSKAQQSGLTDYEPETTTETVTRTIICPLETSNRKTEHLRGSIDEWQAVARVAAERLRSFQKHAITRNNSQVYSISKECRKKNDYKISSTTAEQAAYKATEAFQSWYEKGCPGEPPIGEFGNGDYLRIHNRQVTIEENGRGYGAKLNLVPYKPEWFHISPGEYQYKWLARVCDPEDSTRHGSAEVYLRDGDAALHLTVVSEVEVIVPEGVERWLGVDLGENVLYSTACVGVHSGDIENVELESGKEYRHYRERLLRKRAELSRKGDLRGVKQCKGDIEKYTDWVLHTASKRIVEIATERRPCGIRLEDLTHYRETAKDPIHDWPYAELQTNICYKAMAAGIPVEFVNPRNTSRECNRCGHEGERYGADFECRRCDYHVHADVNAAINIANRDE